MVSENERKIIHQVSNGPENKRTLLIIDDEPEIGEILTDTFQSLFGQIIYCNNAVEAVEVVKSRHIDLICTDMNMPQMTGEEFVVKIRSEGFVTPVIYLTGYASKEVAIAAIKLGVADVFEKPFRSNELVENVERILEIEKRKKSLYAQEYKDSGVPIDSNKNKKMIGLLQIVQRSKKAI